MEKLFLASHENLMNYGDDVLTYFMLEKFPKLPKKLQYAKNLFINTVSVEVYRDDARQYFWSEVPFHTYPGYVFHPVVKECEDISFMPLNCYSKMVNVIRDCNNMEFFETTLDFVRRFTPVDANIYLVCNFLGVLLCKNGMPLLCNAAEGKNSYGEGIDVAMLDAYGGGLLYRQFIHYEDGSYFYLKK